MKLTAILIILSVSSLPSPLFSSAMTDVLFVWSEIDVRRNSNWSKTSPTKSGPMHKSLINEGSQSMAQLHDWNSSDMWRYIGKGVFQQGYPWRGKCVHQLA